MRDKWTYLDSSAFAKLVVAEPESAALRRYLRSRPNRASAGLLRTEAIRVLRRHGRQHENAARRMLQHMLLIRLTPRLLDEAGDLDPPELRSLDAIHLAAARALGADLGGLVTYDAGLAE